MPSPPTAPIPDTAWADYGAASTPPGTAPVIRHIGNQNVDWRPALCFLLIAVCACGLASWRTTHAWRLVGGAGLMAAVGASVGYACSPRRRLGALCGSVSGLVGFLTVIGLRGHWHDPRALATAAGTAGFCASTGLYHACERWLRHRERRSGATFVADVAPAMFIFLEPLPPAADPAEGPLAERLLFLCKQDSELFNRLLNHERSRHPNLKRLDWLKLAIEHLEVDNR